jgi:quercetin dioxygenase-like cupin family protein
MHGEARQYWHAPALVTTWARGSMPGPSEAPARIEAGETVSTGSGNRGSSAKQPRSLGEPIPIPTRPGMSRRSFVGPDDGVRELFVEELTFETGAQIPLHQHPIVEAFVVLEGALTVRLGDETVVVEADHTISIPPGTPHALVNRHDAVARTLSAAPHDHSTFFTQATTYLEGVPRE